MIESDFCARPSGFSISHASFWNSLEADDLPVEVLVFLDHEPVVSAETLRVAEPDIDVMASGSWSQVRCQLLG